MAWFNHPSVEVLTKQHDKLKKSEDVADKISVFFGIAMFIGFLIMITSIITDGFDSDGILIGIMVCLLGGVVFYVFLKVSDSFGKKANLIQEKIKKIRNESFEDKVARGEWEFPSERLYLECEKEGVTAFTTDFNKKKINLIAKNILETKIPAEYFNIYLAETSLEKYFNEGKKIIDEQRKKEAEESLLPKQGNLTEKECEVVKLAQRLKPLYGCEKRKTFLLDAIEKKKSAIVAYKEGQEAMKTLGIVLSNSVTQEKKKDWAVLGGIADGLGGLGAGVAVATQAMLENNEIEKRNKERKQLANEVVSEIYSAAGKVSSDIYDLEKEQQLLSYHLTETSKKVVWEEYTAEEIFEKLEISSSVNMTKNYHGLQLTFDIKSNFKINGLKDVKTVVDGTLQADIYHNDNTFVDSVCIPLPLFGVSTEEKVLMYTDMYVEANGEYTVKVKPNKLWVMEE